MIQSKNFSTIYIICTSYLIPHIYDSSAKCDKLN